MVSERERAHFRALGQAIDELNRQAAAEDGRRSPGEKIAACFELSRLVSTFAASLSRPDEVPPIRRWRELQRPKETR